MLLTSNRCLCLLTSVRKLSQAQIIMAKWSSVPCAKRELSLAVTLSCGQSFRWKEVEPGVWRSVLSGRIWTLKQSEEELLYQVHDLSGEKLPADDTKLSKSDKRRKNQLPVMSISSDKSEKYSPEAVLRDYFQLHISLSQLYDKWQSVDNNFAVRGSKFPGVRILRQDPVENLFSFICSSNNNISRISGMVDKLCVRYGRLVGTVDGEKWYSFPDPSALAKQHTESELRKLGFGYRAKFIHETAKILTNQRKSDWLFKLREVSYDEAHSQLRQLSGVGAKVADCVCLFSLDKTGAIPVDTHVWQIASLDYMPELKTKKSLTDKIYKEIGEYFRELFGEYAGWAHSVLFSADLKKFQSAPEETKGPSREGEIPSQPKKKKRKGKR